jgi:pimeloyl-ACP methyl ester carboxylesterase
MPPLPQFKTPAGEAAFLAAYDHSLSLWPVPYETLRVPTRYGATHVIASGPASAPPLVLLHGYSTTATMWSPNAAALSQQRRLYAVDCVGQAGKSVVTRPLERPADFVEWLLDVLRGLELPGADFCGLSYGGWLSATLAMRAPHVVRRLILLAPAASLLPLRRRFMLFALPMIFFPSRFTVGRYFGWITQGYAMPPDMFEQVYLGMRHWNWGNGGVQPTVFTDAELAGLQAPTLLLIGDREVIYDPRAALARARRLIPRLTAGLLPDASHLLSAERAESVNDRIVAFLEAEAPALA